MTALVFLCLALALVGVGVVLGALLLNERKRGLDVREARLMHVWRGLLAANRINAAYWQAHQAMQREARRQAYYESEGEPRS